MREITVITAENCGSCTKLKKQLKDAGYEIETRDGSTLNSPESTWRTDGTFQARAAMEYQGGFLPVVIAKNEKDEWVGFTEEQALEQFIMKLGAI